MPEVVTDPLLSLVRERGLLDDLQTEEVVQEHTRSGKPVAQVLQDYGLMDLDSILQLMADQLGTMVVAIDETALTPEVVAAVPAESARMYQCLPVALFGDTVQIALVDPFNPQVVDELGFTVKHTLQLVVADPAAVLKAIEKFYPAQGGAGGGYADLLKELGSTMDLSAVEDAKAGGLQAVSFLWVMELQLMEEQQ